MANLGEELREGRKIPDYSDITVTVEGEDFSCHKVILASRSKFFDRALQTDMKEKKEGKIEVKEITAETFAAILQYVYHDENILTNENFFEILLAANQLQVDSLLIKGRQFVTNNLSLDNCGHVYRISQLCGWEDLKKRVWSLLEKNFDRVDMTELDVLTHEDMKRLVASDQLQTRSEDFVVEKVLQWVDLGTCTDPDHDCPEDTGRVRYLPELLRSCKYYLISSNFLWDNLYNNAHVQADVKSRDLVQEILRHQSQLDTHEHGCLSAECRRDTDTAQNYVLAMSGKCFVSKLANLKDTGDYCITFTIPNTIKSTLSGGAFYNGTTYFEVFNKKKGTTRIYEYDLKQKELTCCHEVKNPQDDVTEALFPVGTFLIALRSSGANRGNYFIESISLPCKSSYSWVTVGCPTTRGMEVECVTSIGSKLLIFWKNANPGSLIIECYDLDHQKSYILKDKLSPPTSLKTFKKGDQVFAIQGDGTIWRLQSMKDPLYAKFVQEKQLWTSQKTLQAVVLVKETLIVYRTKPDTPQDIQECDNNKVDGIFTDTFTIDVTGKLVTVFHTVVDKKDMKKVE